MCLQSIDEENTTAPEEKRRKPLHSSPSTEEHYKQLTDTHEREKNELQQKIALQKGRQRQELLDKLAARKTKRENKVGSYFLYTIQYNTIQYNTIQYNTIQYNTIHMIQYNTIQNTLCAIFKW